MLLPWYILISAGIWVASGGDHHYFWDMGSNVIYAELVGMPSNNSKGYLNYGILITTEDKDHLLTYAGIDGRQKLELLSVDKTSRWNVLYGRPTKAKAYDFLSNGPKLKGLSNCNEAIVKFNSFPGVVVHDLPWMESTTVNRYVGYYNVSSLQTAQWCSVLNVGRDQYLRTDFRDVSDITKAELTISYVVTGCAGGQSICERSLRLYVTLLEKHQLYDHFFFPNITQNSKGSLQLNTDKFGVEEKATINLDLRNYKGLAIGLWAKGVCLQVRQLMFMASRCQDREQSLAKYEAVFAPFGGSVTYNGSCVSNAEPQGNDSLKWACNSSGVATYGKGCVCTKGYELVNNSCRALSTARNTNADKSHRTKIIVLSTLASLVALVTALLLIAKLRQRRRAKKWINRPPLGKRKNRAGTHFWNSLLRMKKSRFNYSLVVPVYENVDHYEFPRDDLAFVSLLGDGQFTSVHLAQTMSVLGWVGRSTVAVKMLKESAGQKLEANFLAELDLLKGLGHHENVVRFLGCCTHHGPPWIILEYMEKGDLRTFVRTQCDEGDHGIQMTTLSFPDMLSFALMVAKGMKFVSEKGIVHRDLAARNILLDEHNKCKIADFEMARDLNKEGVFYPSVAEEGKLPVKWTAPECMQREQRYQCTTKSDVWSFGVLLWEIFSCGEEPYGEKKSGDVRRLLDIGYRMQSPENCPKEMYQVMLACWADDPDLRPAFSQLVDIFLDAEVWVTAIASCRAYWAGDFIDK